MSDLNNWFSPVKELTPGDSAKVIPALVGLIKEKTSSISCSKPGRACSPIMTAIRMLLCYITPDPSAAKGGYVLFMWVWTILCEYWNLSFWYWMSYVGAGSLKWVHILKGEKAPSLCGTPSCFSIR